MAIFNFNFKFLKENATPGAWRRGYEYYQKEMILQSYPEKNFYMGKVKGNFQEAYNTDLIFKKNKVEARCSCPLKDEWCKHSVAVAIKAINENAYEKWLAEKHGVEVDLSDIDTALKTEVTGNYVFHFNAKRRQNFFSILIRDRATNKIVRSIESVLSDAPVVMK